jgi:flagellar basal-body rod modification protein FlgD
MSSVNGVNSTNTDTSASTTTSSAATASKTEFLKLLVAQLQNQDPMNPMDNQDFLAQLATFSSLEQLISINTAVSKLAGTSEDTGSDSQKMFT